MLNGPCGGLRENLCEVDDFECPFVKAFENLKSENYLKPLLDREFRVSCEVTPLEPRTEFMKRLKGGKFQITAEVEPWNLESLEEASKLPYHTLNVTDNPLGIPHIDVVFASAHLRSKGKEVIAQLTCRARTREALTSAILALEISGVWNLLALTGDWAPNSSFDLDSVRLLCLAQALRKGFDWSGRKVGIARLHLGVAVNPYFKYEKLRAIRKAKAGAEFGQSQPIFDESILDKLLDMPFPTFPSILLTTSKKVLRYLMERGVKVPKDYYEGLVRAKNEGRADEYVLEKGKELLEGAFSKEAPGVHLMSPGRHDLLFKFWEIAKEVL